MLAEALRYLIELGVLGGQPVELEVGDAENVVYYTGDVMPLRVARGMPPRNHKAGALAEIMALAKRFDGHGVEQYDPVVWYDNSRVVLTIDDMDYRHNQVTLQLVQSDQYNTLIGLASNKKWMDQKEFTRLLKVELSGAIADNTLIDRIRKIKFENGVIVDSAQDRGKESLGKTIKAEVFSTGGEIPDEVQVCIPVYSTLGEDARWSLTCAVELDPAQGLKAFRLTPLPDEIIRIGKLAVGSIADRLKAGLPEGVACHLGSP